MGEGVGGEAETVHFRSVKAFPDGEVMKYHSRQVIMPKCLGWGKLPPYQKPGWGVWDRIMSQILLQPQGFTILLPKDAKTLWYLLGSGNSIVA